MKAFIADWFAALFFLAVVYVLVRPRSKAAETVKFFGDAMVSIVRAATDL